VAALEAVPLIALQVVAAVVPSFLVPLVGLAV